MAEKDLWHTMQRHVKFFGHFDRIENMIGRGMPDVTYACRKVEGFIELKHADAWPVKPDTPLALPHYTPQQRIWSQQRMQAGGRVYVLLQVDHEYFLMHSAWARVYLGKTATQADIRRASIVVGGPKFPTPEILKALTGVFTAT